MANPFRFAVLVEVLNIDADLFTNTAALAGHLAKRPERPRLKLDPGVAAGIMSELRRAQAQGTSVVLTKGGASTPNSLIEAAKTRGGKRLRREWQVRRGEERVKQFLEQIARKRRPTRERLIREAEEALGVLREVARQIAEEPEAHWTTRRSSKPPFSLDLRLTTQQLAVLNRLLRRSTVWEGFLCGPPLQGGAHRVAFRDLPLRKGEPVLHALLGWAARSLVQLLSPKLQHRLAICRAPLAWGGRRRQTECGRFVVVSVRGGRRDDAYCSKTCKQNAHMKRSTLDRRTNPIPAPLSQ